MCWFANEGEVGYEKNLIAEKDITVYKIVKKNKYKIVPFVYSHTKIEYGYIDNDKIIPYNKLLTTKMITSNHIMDLTMYVECNVAFHSFAENSVISVKENTRLFLETPNGIYSDFGRDMFIMKCTIPKKSTYRVNSNGEVVSNNLMVEEIKPANTITCSEFIYAGPIEFKNFFNGI